MKDDSTQVLGGLVDRLAMLKAQIANLKKEEDSVKRLLIDAGVGVVEGTLHRAAISTHAGRDMVDWEAVAMRFSPSAQLIRAHTVHGDAYTCVRVSARKTR